jgi:hypothetical protein
LPDFSNYFHILADLTGFSPSIPFLFGLDPLAGREAGIMFLPRLTFSSRWRVQVAHRLTDVIIRILLVTTVVLTCAVRSICGPRFGSVHSRFALDSSKAVGRKYYFFFQREEVWVTSFVFAGTRFIFIYGWGSHP